MAKIKVKEQKTYHTDCDGYTYKVALEQCECPRLQMGTDLSDRGTEFNWYYCPDCGFDQVS